MKTHEMVGGNQLGRRATLGVLFAFGAFGVCGTALAQASQPAVKVWKSPTCGCCGDWIVHLEGEGFPVEVHNEGNTAARSRLGVPMRFGSCHTASVDGYAIEGHVPAPDIRRLLRERPNAIGLAVPGMPVGSPGMDGPAYGARRDPFNVLLVTRDGDASVFSTHP